MADDHDLPARLAAFDFLEEQTQRHGDALPRATLEKGFVHDGRRIPLLGPQGIFKPAAMELPLSLTTAPVVGGRPRPYEDEITKDGLIAYRYRGSEPLHRDNVGLRRAMAGRTPLVYFFGLVPGQYAAAWPSFVVADDPSSLTFTIAADEPHTLTGTTSDAAAEPIRRRYATGLQLHRLHQAEFRQRVVRAYHQACAICRLRHDELLDAAHILPDGHPLGEPTVPNGLALCKLHHAAFDRNIVGIRSDLVVEVSLDVLHEIDGPMLIHGLQGWHGAPLQVPRPLEDRPNPDFLAERYEVFRRAG